MVVAPPNELVTIAIAIQHNMHMAQRQTKIFYASHVPLKLQIGETIIVYYTIHKAGLYKSFMHRWLGPYTVLAQIGT